MNKALFFEMNKVKKYKTVSEICLVFFLSFLKKYKREGGINSVRDLLVFLFFAYQDNRYLLAYYN